MRRLLSSIRRDEQGFSLPELVVTMAIGSIIIAAALGLLEFTMKRSSDVSTRIDANQRGRMALDAVTRQLRSQVCLNASVKPLVVAKTNELTFYGDLRDNGPGVAPVPQKRTVKLDTATSTLIEQVSTGTETASGVYSWSTPVSRTLLTDVTQDGSTPLFRYHVYNPGVVPPELTPIAPGTGASLTQNDMDRVAKIEIRFKANPNLSGASPKSAVVLYDDVFSRLVNPNRATSAAAPKQECV